MSKSSLFDYTPEFETDLQCEFRAWIEQADFPCVGAKAALARDTLQIIAGRFFNSGWDDLRIHNELMKLAKEYRVNPVLFRSFAIVFERPVDLSEELFENCLWGRLQSLSDKDVWLGQNYDQRVSCNPNDPHFSLSFGGEAFFVVGLHPRASRPARRFSYPTIVFNLHDQFEQLRSKGLYEGMREKILRRDEALAGSPNPMLARHGITSEAPQYSGRHVDPNWRCPFHYKREVD